MAKRITVQELTLLVNIESDDIPVTVKERTVKENTKTVCQAKSLYWLASHGTSYVLEAKVKELKIGKDNILIYIQPKPCTSKL